MKSRTSFFDATVFKKNFTRFAPAWILYTLGLLMCLMLLTSGPNYFFPDNLSESLMLMPIAGAVFALLCALLLFGDLFNSRMCYALHAMPQRRETYFITHWVTGLTFNAIATAESLGLKKIGDTTVQPDNAMTMGKINQISYLICVEEMN